MLGWTDRRCRQDTENFKLPFPGISVLLAGDIAQLLPVLDKLLHYEKQITKYKLQVFVSIMNLAKL